jgi:CHAT domain-containing protein
MEAFYTRVLSGESVPKSLSDAEAEVANAPEWRHPYFWAGFDAFGTA